MSKMEKITKTLTEHLEILNPSYHNVLNHKVDFFLRLKIRMSIRDMDDIINLFPGIKENVEKKIFLCEN